MNWEESRVITPLKRDFLKAFFERTQQFYLTGGSALGLFYLNHRFSYDLDFFTPDKIDWHIHATLVRDAADSLDAVVTGLISSPYFHRFELVRRDEGEILDFVIELVAQADPQKPQHGLIRVDTMREIGINKLCTLVGRCEAKDVVDLYFLCQEGFDVAGNIEAARKKDGGVDAATMSFVLSEMRIGMIPDFLVRPVGEQDIAEFVERLRRDLASRAFPIDDHQSAP